MQFNPEYTGWFSRSTIKTVGFTGTVIRATMRSQDLVPVFMDVLFRYYREAHDLATDGIFDAFGLTYTELCGQPLHAAWQSSEMGYLLHETLWDAMDEIAPEGYYFGAHPGDGCDYGYWKVLDPNEETCCQFCGRSDLTLLACPVCDELLCQNCLDTNVHVCEPE